MPIATLGAVVLDCPDPVALARFYTALIGGTVEDDGGRWVDLTGPRAPRSPSRPPPGSYPRSGPGPTAPSSSTWT